jgi:hypothetical protein
MTASRTCRLGRQDAEQRGRQLREDPGHSHER